MHLAIDGTGARFGGAATSLLEFLFVALGDARISRITLFCSPASRMKFKFPVSHKLRVIEKDWVDRNYFLRLLWYEFLLGLACKRVGADLLFASANFGRGRNGIPHVTYVQQSLPFSREAVDAISPFDRLRVSAYGRQMRHSCTSAIRVICQSRVMRDCLLKEFSILEEKIEVVYSCPRRLPEAVGDHGRLETMRDAPPGGRLLFVGDPYPYKMLQTAIEGLRLLRKVRPTACLFLTVKKSRRSSREPGVFCLDYLDPGELSEAYKLADGLVLPSLVESGPQPPLEAMSLGTPVLIADRPYARDIFGNAALLFDPRNPIDFSEKALSLLQDGDLRRRLVEAGFSLVEKRNAARPYQRIIDICVESLSSRDA